MAKILIAGCGAIGLELAQALANSGHPVTGIKRNPPSSNLSNIQFYKADISRAEDLDGLESGFEQALFILSPDRRDELSYRNVYETGLGNLINKFTGAGCDAPWIFVSSTSVYGQRKGEWVDENSATMPNSATSRIILAAEKKLLALNPGNIAVRFSGIYGPGREYLIRKAKDNPKVQHNPPYYTNRIHQKDCVSVLKFLIEQRLAGRKLEQSYLVSDDDPAPLWDVMVWLTHAMGLPPPAPEEHPTDADMNKRCRNDRIKELGFTFDYPDYRKGYAEIVLKSRT